MGNVRSYADKLVQFLERQLQWEHWWSRNRRRFVTEAELDSLRPPSEDHDLIQQAGIARFGSRFPAGPSIELGPVREFELVSTIFKDAETYFDLDTVGHIPSWKGWSLARRMGRARGDNGLVSRESTFSYLDADAFKGIDLHLCVH